MPTVLKIGRTGRTVDTRAKELSRPTGVPTPFQCEYTLAVDDSIRAERIVHRVLDRYRIHPRREFFKVPHLDIVRACFDTLDAYQCSAATEPPSTPVHSSNAPIA
jgi:hypothetical protein